ncbi:MAG: hypothetical protein OEZ06_01285 [Myxococcales bacterium]|nr:hypothetical protein [Myxococcales bacterium]
MTQTWELVVMRGGGLPPWRLRLSPGRLLVWTLAAVVLGAMGFTAGWQLGALTALL